MDRQEKRVKGICYDCHEPAEPNKARCKKHLSGNKTIQQERFADGRSKPVREQLKPYQAKWRREHRRNKGRFGYVKGHAVRKGKTWTLTKEEFETIIAQPCAYCGLPNSPSAGTGLDRINNSIGYESGNVVSCCNECNCARSDHFSQDEMKIIGKAIRIVKLARD